MFIRIAFIMETNLQTQNSPAVSPRPKDLIPSPRNVGSPGTSPRVDTSAPARPPARDDVPVRKPKEVRSVIIAGCVFVCLFLTQLSPDRCTP
jgi:hypothetical protein